MYATLMVPTLDDNTTELSEYFKVVITSTYPTAVEIGSPSTSYITIVDNDPGTCTQSDYAVNTADVHIRNAA